MLCLPCFTQIDVLLVNQHTVPVFIDVVNAFAEKHASTVLFTGHIEQGGKPLSKHVKVVKSFSYRRGSSFARLLSWILFSLHYFFYLLKLDKPDKILVVSNPPIAPILTAFVSGIRKIPFYILVFDLYPDALMQAGFVTKTNMLFRFWRKLNHRYFSRAEKVFTLSDSMKDAVLKYMPRRKKVKVIHNWADLSYIRPLDKSKNPFLEKHCLHGKKIILYSGNMGLTHDLESLVDAAELLRSRSNLAFVFIGDGAKKTLLQQMVAVKKLQNVVFLPYQDAVDFPHAMAAADIGVVTLGKGAEGISVPSKTYINLAAGLCLLAIAPESSELSRLIIAHRAGVICEPGDYYGIAKSIHDLTSEDQLLNSYKTNALEASVNFTSENARRYVEETMSA